VSRTDLARRLRLIVVTDAALARPRTLLDVVAAALSAGAPAIQLRDKEASARELLTASRQLLPLVREAGALFFVNDRVDVALAAGADGVHVGPHDLPVESLRRAVGTGFLIGASCDDPEAARRLVEEGADYIGCGAVYPTGTKPDAGEAIGPAGLDRVARAVSVPVVGIGGITEKRSAEVATTHAAGVAVISGVMCAPDVASAVRGILAPWSGRD